MVQWNIAFRMAADMAVILNFADPLKLAPEIE
jgi:hypothetical protein